MINNEIYTWRDVSQQIAVIINIDNQNFLYKIKENAYIHISDKIQIFSETVKIFISYSHDM